MLLLPFFVQDISKEQAFGLVELNEEMQAKLAKLQYAVLATPANIFAPAISTYDIEAMLAEGYNIPIQGTNITSFSPHFILEFPTKHLRDTILQHKVLEGPNFTLVLCPWMEDNNCYTLRWDTKITIDIYGLPPHAYDHIALGPLLNHRCDIRKSTFNKDKGICTVEGYTYNLQAIPPHSFFSYPERFDGYRVIHAFPATIKARLYSETSPSDNEWVPDPSLDLEDIHSDHHTNNVVDTSKHRHYIN